MNSLFYRFVLISSLIISSFLNSQTFSFDSLAFFEREKITTLKLKQSYRSKTFRTTTIKFDKNKIYFESQLAGEKSKNYDTSVFVNGIAVSDPKSIMSLDNKGRITRIIDYSDKRVNIREFLYADTISKQLRMVVNQCENEFYKVQVYFYNNFKLIKVIETFYSLLNNENKKIWEKTYHYEYGLNNRVIKECIIQDGKSDYISEFIY